MSTFYKIDGSDIARLRKECPRCGRGVFLAEHKDRLTCGTCRYTSFNKRIEADVAKTTDVAKTIDVN